MKYVAVTARKKKRKEKDIASTEMDHGIRKTIYMIAGGGQGSPSFSESCLPYFRKI